MASRRINVFFYGLFMAEDALRAKGLRPVNSRLARVPGFALRIGERATLVPASGASAYGVVMELSHDEIERLYGEPSVRMYRPEGVIADVDGVRIPALCFNLPVAPLASEANEEYAKKLAELARHLGLPEDYVDSIA